MIRLLGRRGEVEFDEVPFEAAFESGVKDPCVQSGTG